MERDWEAQWEDKRRPAGRGDGPGPQSPSCRRSQLPAGAAWPLLKGREGHWPRGPGPCPCSTAQGTRRLGAYSCPHIRPRVHTQAPACRPALQRALCPSCGPVWEVPIRPTTPWSSGWCGAQAWGGFTADAVSARSPQPAGRDVRLSSVSLAPLPSRRKVAQGPSDLGQGTLSSEHPAACLSRGQFSSAACHLGPGTSHAHPTPASRTRMTGPAAWSGPAAWTRVRAGFPSMSTGTAHESRRLGAEAGLSEGLPGPGLLWRAAWASGRWKWMPMLTERGRRTRTFHPPSPESESIQVTHLPSPAAPNRAAWTCLSGTLSALGCHGTTRDPGKQPDPEEAGEPSPAPMPWARLG